MNTSRAVSETFQLKWLHQEIDLYDRKLAHLDKYSPETSAAERKKIAAKRVILEKTARRMAAEGVEFKQEELPRSFRSTDTAA